MRRTLDRQDVEDLSFGLALLGTGGGGDPDQGLKFLLEDLEAGREIAVIDVDDVAEDALTATSFYMGSIAPPKPEVLEIINKWGNTSSLT